MDSKLVISLESQAAEVPEWICLLPLGEAVLGDEREPLLVDPAALKAMVQNFRGRGLDLVIDYEHQTLSGHKAPAAGWIKDLETREDGLWAQVEWTEAARGHLEAKEYRYFSPVLRLDQESRRPLAPLHVALSNTPAINHLAPLVAKSRDQGSGVRGQGRGRAAPRQ
jgi:phage I-like protein